MELIAAFAHCWFAIAWAMAGVALVGVAILTFKRKSTSSRSPGRAATVMFVCIGLTTAGATSLSLRISQRSFSGMSTIRLRQWAHDSQSHLARSGLSRLTACDGLRQSPTRRQTVEAVAFELQAHSDDRCPDCGSATHAASLLAPHGGIRLPNSALEI